jgi:hypothetical protein
VRRCRRTSWSPTDGWTRPLSEPLGLIRWHEDDLPGRASGIRRAGGGRSVGPEGERQQDKKRTRVGVGSLTGEDRPEILRQPEGETQEDSEHHAVPPQRGCENGRSYESAARGENDRDRRAFASHASSEVVVDAGQPSRLSGGHGAQQAGDAAPVGRQYQQVRQAAPQGHPCEARQVPAK